MATETIVAVFDTTAEAEKVVNELEAAGVPSSAIQHYSKGSGYGQGTTLSGSSTSGSGGGFWSWLFGEDTGDTDRSIYDRTVESGGTVVTVIVDDRQADRAVSILEAHSPVDLQERASQYGYAQTATTGAGTGTAATGYAAGSGASSLAGAGQTGTEQVIPLAEERLDVGKREVSGGTTRLRRYVVERPVEEQIRLRNERVSVERRPVSGTATVAPDAFTEKTIEVTETSEEAVVAKTARVAEEVVVRKDVDERVETVRDTVRKEEVEVDRPTGRPSIPGATPSTSR